MEQELDDNSKSINIIDVVRSTLRHWPWIVASVAICVGLAVFYVLRSHPVYSRTASIVIKDDTDGSSISNDLNAFADMGLINTNSNIIDEINKLKSPDVMNEVISRLNLDINYSVPGTFHKNVVYGSTLPVRIELPSLLQEESASATVEVDKNGKYVIYDIKRNGEEYPFEQAAPVPLDSTLITPLGAVTLRPTDYFVLGDEYTVYISKSPFSLASNGFSSAITIEQPNKDGNTINLTVKDRVPQRAEDLINAVIDVYNEIWIDNKNQVAVSTSNFINERLRAIEQELGSVDQDISSYQSEHLIPDVQQAASLYMAENQKAEADIIGLNNQLQMTRYMRDFLTDARNLNAVLPANTGINSSSIEKQISDYNKIQLLRNEYAANSSDAHPMVMSLDTQIADMRKAVINAIDNQILAIETQIKNLQKNKSQTTAKIASNPTQAKYLLSVERQQKVKEALYLFLLQKREENELSQAFTAYNTQIIAKPHGLKTPIAPRKVIIVFAAFIFGLIIPFGATYVMQMLNTRVRGRKDLENLAVPFLGEIPMIKFRKGQKENFVVKQGSRNVINEAFRVLRTNIGFVSSQDSSCNVIMITSFNAGSGKSFIAINLALSLAIRGKRVLVIDGDLRHASASAAIGSPSQGLSEYLVGKVNDVNSVIVKYKECEKLEFLPVGTIPPNPTELLESDRFPTCVEELRKHFDYIFIDCPPVGMLADAQIVEQVVDRTLFVVRAGLLDRSMLPELDKLYQSKKFKNMGIVLNSTSAEESRYGYGYKYGYGYGYGYGYHSKSDED